MSKKPNTLRARCLAESPKLGRATWADKIDKALRDQVIDLIREWDQGGEISQSYPTLTQLCNWLSSLDEIPASGAAIIRFAKDLIEGFRNGKS